MKFLTPGSSATTLAWSGCLGPRVPLSVRCGPIFLKGTLRLVLVVSQCELGIAVGVGYWFPPLSVLPAGSVVYAPVAQCGGVYEDGLDCHLSVSGSAAFAKSSLLV